MRKLEKKIRLVFLSLIFVLQFSLFLTPNISQAQVIPDAIDTTKEASEELPVYNSGVDESIKEYLCTPEGKGTDLVDCVGKLYRFGITIGVIALIFFLVVAGYIYIVSGESGKTKAKQMLYSAFTGMAIILGSYTLLSFINPALVQVRTIQPPIFETVDMPSCEDIGFSTRCKISTGPSAGQVFGGSGGAIGSNSGCRQCTSGLGSIAYLEGTCLKADAEVGSFVAAGESTCGKNILNTTTGACADGNPAMIGMFQVNITVHKLDGGKLDCPSAFSGGGFTAKNKSCRVRADKKDLYNQCKAYASDPANSVKKSCEIIAERKALKQKTWYPTWHAADCLHKKGLDNFR